MNPLMARPCGNCEFIYGKHAVQGELCPLPNLQGFSNSVFKELGSVTGILDSKIEVADQGKALQQGIESLRIGTGGEVPAITSPLKDSRSEHLCRSVLNTGDGVSNASVRNSSGELTGCQVRFLGAHEAADPQVSLQSARGDKGMAFATASESVPEKFIHSLLQKDSRPTFIECVLMCLEGYDAKQRIISKLPDLELDEQYRIEEYEAEAETNSYEGRY